MVRGEQGRGEPGREMSSNQGTLRLEVDVGRLQALTQRLSCDGLGELMSMLVAEARGLTPSSDSQLINDLYDRRDEYSRIAGAPGRSPLPLAVRVAVWERDGKRCTYCECDLPWSLY